MREHYEKMASAVQREALGDASPSHTMTLELQPPELPDNKVCSVHCPVQCFTVALEQRDPKWLHFP